MTDPESCPDPDLVQHVIHVAPNTRECHFKSLMASDLDGQGGGRFGSLVLCLPLRQHVATITREGGGEPGGGYDGGSSITCTQRPMLVLQHIPAR